MGGSKRIQPEQSQVTKDMDTSITGAEKDSHLVDTDPDPLSNLDDSLGEDDDYLKLPLLVPNDPIEGLDWLPDFSDDPISLNDLLCSPDMETPSPSYSNPTAGEAPKTNSINEKAESSSGGNVRWCSHCQTRKTPQWRNGPLGPKTLCNACGVRFKSGRLEPEYRPASSPSFDGSKHSNYHNRILEMRASKQAPTRKTL